MLDKLRRQFILIIMALVTAALAIMAGVIIYINYQQLSSDVKQSVEYATTAFAFEGRISANNAQRPDGAAADGTAMSRQSGQSASASEGEPDAVGAGDLVGNVADDAYPHGGNHRTERAPGADMVPTSVYFVDADGAISQTLVNALELDDATVQAALAAAL